MERRVVYGGGGSRRRLIEISPERIAEYQGAEIMDISDR
jgi:prolyl-tRNA editing enzyme YbaK/EbsC (Cys-tRNA(Pro) deacylase)